MEEKRKYTFSMDAPECRACVLYNECKNKRRVACIYLDQLTDHAAQQSAQTVTADVMVKHDYRDIKIGGNMKVTIDLEEMKRKMSADIYKALGCPFMNGS